MRSSFADTPILDSASVIPHGASLGAILAAAFGYLPVIVALVPAVYYCVLIYESKTVQKWLRGRRLRRAAKRRAAPHPTKHSSNP